MRQSILIGYDREGWAFHRIAQKITEHLPDFHCISAPMFPALEDYSEIVAFIAVYWGSAHWHALPDGCKRYMMVYDHRTWRDMRAEFEARIAVADGIFASSDLLAEDLRQEFGIHPIVCTDGVDGDVFRHVHNTRLNSDELVVGWAGNSKLYDGLKGFHLLEEAVEKTDGVRLVVADPATHQRVAAEDMPAFYEQIDLLACCSESEGTPNPVLEAASVGRAIMSTWVGIVPQFDKDGVVHSIERNVDSIRHGLELFRDNRELLRAYGDSNAFATRAKWTWRQALKPLTTVIRRDNMIPGATDKPMVLVVYDSPGWAFHRIAEQIRKYLSGDCEVELSGYVNLPQVVHHDVVIQLAYHAMPHLYRVMLDDVRVITCMFDEELWKRDPRSLAGLCMAANFSSHWLFANEGMRDRVLEIPEIAHIKSWSTCQDGVDTKMFYQQPYREDYKTTPLRVGWAGNAQNEYFGDLKGLDIIRQAVDELDDVELIIADGGDLDNRLDHFQMPLFYRDIDVYCCMSRCEGTPNPILEASSVGRAWISTNVGIVPELHRDSANRCGIIVDRDVESLKKALMRLRDNRDELPLMGQAGAAACQTCWDWSKRVDAYRRAVKTVMNGH